MGDDPDRVPIVVRARTGVLICGVLAAAMLATVAPASQAQSVALQRFCLHAFPAANQVTRGHTTSYNRQASVENVACDGFGSSVKFSINGGVVCSLLSAAIGRQYAKLALYVDGDCSAAQLAANHETGTVAAVACTMLGDLLHAIPWAKAYAAGVGIACAFGQPLGSWIESESERVAAKGVIQSGKCLQFTTHGFPIGDTWSAVACKRGDRGFTDLPVAGGPVQIAYSGRIGALTIGVSTGADITRALGQPNYLTTGSFDNAPGVSYELFGYGCKGSVCSADYYVNAGTGRLESFETTSQQFVLPDGVRVGMSATVAANRERRPIELGCAGIAVTKPKLLILLPTHGGHRLSNGHITGGRVAAIAIDDRAFGVGVTFC
jgi:hypothetical protein